MCSSRKNPYPLHGKSLEFPRGRRVLKAKFLEAALMCSSRKNPNPLHGKSLEFPRGRRVLKAKCLDAMYENKPEFPWGTGGGGAKQKTSCGGSMDIFQYCIIQTNHVIQL